MRVYCAILLYGIFQFIVGWTWQAFCFLLPSTAVFVPLTFVPGLFFLPIHAILQTVVYLNLRIDKESLNADVLQQDLSMDDSRYTPLLNLDEEEEAAAREEGEKTVSFAQSETEEESPESSEVV